MADRRQNRAAGRAARSRGRRAAATADIIARDNRATRRRPAYTQPFRCAHRTDPRFAFARSLRSSDVAAALQRK